MDTIFMIMKGMASLYLYYSQGENVSPIVVDVSALVVDVIPTDVVEE